MPRTPRPGPYGSTIVAEVFADVEGRPVDGPAGAHTVEVELLGPDGSLERVYLVAVAGS